jgi:type II secretory pathway component PulK
VNGPQRSRPDRGFALLIVLWFLVLLTLIATRLVGDARVDLALARNILVAARAEALADAAVMRAVYLLGDPRPDQRWNADDAPRKLALAEGEATILVEDERAKINVNHASRELMTALFTVLGTDQGAAEAAIEAILRHRGGDNGGAQQAGAVAPAAAPSPGTSAPAASAAAPSEAASSGAPPSGSAAAGSGPPGSSKGRPFVALEEIAGLPQMNAVLFAVVRPYLTPYGESAEPDPKKAPAPIRRALETLHRSGAGAPPASPGQAPQANDAAAPAGFQVIDAPADAAGTPATAAIFRIVAVAKTADAEFRREAVVKLDPSSAKGYGMLAWQALPAPEP